MHTSSVFTFKDLLKLQASALLSPCIDPGRIFIKSHIIYTWRNVALSLKPCLWIRFFFICCMKDRIWRLLRVFSTQLYVWPTVCMNVCMNVQKGPVFWVVFRFIYASLSVSVTLQTVSVSQGRMVWRSMTSHDTPSFSWAMLATSLITCTWKKGRL